MQTGDSGQRKELLARLLVMRCQAGDEQAFADLHESHGAAIRRYVAGFLGPDVADDIVQEVWLTVFRRIRELTNPGGFRTWLFRIARHRSIDALRARQRRETLEEQAFAEIGRVLPATQGLEDAAREVVGDALARLSPAHREAIQLRYLEDLTYGDIATVMGCPVGTVRSRIHHARTQLRDALMRLDPDLITK